MLLYQGVEAFEVWTGRQAPVGAMNDTLRAQL
jgi:shikimate dehydrogenase